MCYFGLFLRQTFHFGSSSCLKTRFFCFFFFSFFFISRRKKNKKNNSYFLRHHLKNILTMWDSLVRALDTKNLNGFLQKETQGIILLDPWHHPAPLSPGLIFLASMGSKLDMIKKNQNPSLDFEPWVKVVVLKKFVI